jgi:DNA-binding MarR family transcriptional regulator
MSLPFADLDELVHQRSRLGIMTLLKGPGELEFRVLKEQLALTDGNLSQHLRTLEEAGYVAIRKGYEGRRPRTWARLTKVGERALAQEVALLRRIVDQSAVAEPRTTTRKGAVRAPRLSL